MKFSVIVPVYNVEKFIHECVDSILNQTFTDYELILVDDGSADNCPTICDDYSKIDSRVKVIHKSNGGASLARNIGLDIAVGEYIIFVDSDDKLNSKDAFSVIDGIINDNAYPDIIISNTWHYNIKYKNAEELLFSLIKMRGAGKEFSLTPWDKIYKAEYLREYNIRFAEGFTQEDLLWTLVAIANARTAVITDENFIERGINEYSVTRNVSENATYHRAISKLNIAKLGVDYFQESDFGAELKSAAYEFYIGIYNSGLKEGQKIKSQNNISEFNSEICKTKDIYRVGKMTANKKYRVLSVIYNLFGIKPIIALAKL